MRNYTLGMLLWLIGLGMLIANMVVRFDDVSILGPWWWALIYLVICVIIFAGGILIGTEITKRKN